MHRRKTAKTSDVCDASILHQSGLSSIEPHRSGGLWPLSIAYWKIDDGGRAPKTVTVGQCLAPVWHLLMRQGAETMRPLRFAVRTIE